MPVCQCDAVYQLPLEISGLNWIYLLIKCELTKNSNMLLRARGGVSEYFLNGTFWLYGTVPFTLEVLGSQRESCIISGILNFKDISAITAQYYPWGARNQIKSGAVRVSWLSSCTLSIV